MEISHVVVDGSNIATEGRSLPSLRQLDESVRSFIDEFHPENLTVIVDATFGHRIEGDERQEYEEAVTAGEMITPPAGTIGRGDAFILEVADRADATVLSNDSFQELHGKYPWLFDEGRLVGGKPVPGIGWVFMARTPVRGPISRKSVKEARRPQKAKADNRNAGRRDEQGRGERGSRKASRPAPTRTAETGRDNGRRGRRRTRQDDGGPINAPLAFIEFVGAHLPGSTVEAVVERFSSHGAYVRVGDTVCYAPLRSMGDPPPRSPRDVLRIGETARFVVERIDTPRRGIDLGLVVDESIAGRASTANDGGRRPTQRSERSRDAGGREAHYSPDVVDDSRDDLAIEPVSAGEKSQRGDVDTGAGGLEPNGSQPRRQRARRSKANTGDSATVTNETADISAEEAPVTPVKKAAAKKAAKKAPAKKAPAKKTAAKKTAKKAPAKKAAKKTTKKVAKKTTKRAPAKKAVKKTAKKAPARKAPAKKAAKKTAKKAPARKATKKAVRKR